VVPSSHGAVDIEVSSEDMDSFLEMEDDDAEIQG
jgi:hypothetical protein